MDVLRTEFEQAVADILEEMTPDKFRRRLHRVDQAVREVAAR